MRLTLIVGVLLLAFYAGLINYVPSPAIVKTQSQWQDNQQALEQYVVSGATARAVVVGSSLSRRLDLRPLGACFYNLSAAGESSLTGLRTIAESRHRPDHVLVEINVPQRPANTKLVKAATGLATKHFALLRTENVPVNRLLSALYQRAPVQGERLGDVAFYGALALQQATYAQPLPQQTIAHSLEQYADAIENLERQGTTVSLFEMPVHPSLEDLVRAKQIRQAFRNAFPRIQWISYAELSAATTIRTTDGVHLEIGEAAAVTARLSNLLGVSCPPTPGTQGGPMIGATLMLGTYLAPTLIGICRPSSSAPPAGLALRPHQGLVLQVMKGTTSHA